MQTATPVNRRKQAWIDAAIARRRDDGLPALTEAELKEVGEAYDKAEALRQKASIDKRARQKAAEGNPIVLANSNNAPPTANPKEQGTILPNPDLPAIGMGSVNDILASLNPASVALGSPSFDVHVLGANFTPGSVIVFNGYDEPTTFVSANELTTGVNMDVWAAPAVVPVAVRAEDGSMSNALDFEFTAAAARAQTQASTLPKK